MKSVAIIGAGISGLSIANMLIKNDYEVTVFEENPKPGGLISCERIDGNLYHVVGGHVFNSKRKDVLEWFWSFFNREQEFTQSTRNAVIFIGKFINYPIENHIYQLDENQIKSVISDLLEIARGDYSEPENFGEFLKNRFGNTLYNMYFKPYNEKIWNSDLASVSLSWLDGKLPMPSIEEIIFNNFHRRDETEMVHSSFFYPKIGGSQFIADRLSENVDVEYNLNIESINYINGKWILNNESSFDKIVYTGNVKKLPTLMNNSKVNINSFARETDKLGYHGTTTVLCEIEENPFSWIYIPDIKIKAHRIICTGNFSENNNSSSRTATIEFTDKVEKELILENLKELPFNPRYITHRYTQYTYPIQEKNTRNLIKAIKAELNPMGFYLLGRFAEWEYYNMDAVIGASMDLVNTKLK